MMPQMVLGRDGDASELGRKGYKRTVACSPMSAFCFTFCCCTFLRRRRLIITLKRAVDVVVNVAVINAQLYYCGAIIEGS